MIPNTNKINIWTIITNMLILIGAGHGVGSMLLIEIALFFHRDPLYFSLTQSYNNLLATSGLFSLVGQVVLVISMLMNGYMELIFKIAGLLFLYVGLLYLGANLTHDPLSGFSLFFSIPFVILSVVLLVKQIKLGNNEAEQL